MERKYNTYEIGKIINKFHKRYSQLNTKDIPEYTKNLIKLLKTRNMAYLDIQVVMAAIITKKQKYMDALEIKDSIEYRDYAGTYQFIEKVYGGEII